MNATVTTTANANGVNNKIQDFGRKIGGARKDYAAEAKAEAEKFANSANPEALKGCKTLGALVKLPNLEQLAKVGAISADEARAVLTSWRTIERKPSTPWRAGRWAENTAPVLARIGELLAGGEVSDKEKEGAEFRTLSAAGWPSVAFSFGAYTVKDSRPSCYGIIINSQDGGKIRIIKGGWVQAYAQNYDEAAQKITELCAKDSEKRAEGPALAASINRAGVWYIHPEHNKEINIKTLPAGTKQSEVKRILTDERAELVARLHDLQTVPDFRRDWNRPRTGKDWRNGQNVTPEQFAHVIPFYGVEFGNWVTQTERAALLNSAFDGFHDLADLFGLTADRCALGGSLAFAFASRGIPKAMAHYESDRKVINLTKKNGAGCMAHEWFHALDNWTMYRQNLNGFATEAPKTATTAEGVAGFALLEAIRNTEFYKRSQNLASIKGDYWTKGRELAARGFEGVCAFLLKVSGVCSDFLVNCLDIDEFTKADTFHRGELFPYPTEAEAATLAPYYFDFMAAAFGEGVKMSAEVRQSVEALRPQAEKEHAEELAKRHERADEEARQREEVRQLAQTHAEAQSIENRQKVEKVTADTVAETGAKWSHMFEHCGKFYAVGGGVGFVFLVWYSGRVGFRVLQENNKIKKPFRGAHLYYLEYRKGVNIEQVIKEDLKNGFSGNYFNNAEMLDVFKHTYASTWEEFKAQHAKELEAAQNVNRYEVKEDKPQQEAPKGEKMAKTENETKTEGAKSEGVELVEIAGGVAVVGNTYPVRKEIKAKGAKWNKDAKRWEATTAEAVAALREWFGVSDEQTAPASQNTTTEAETSETAEISIITQSEKVEKSEEIQNQKDDLKQGEEIARPGSRWGVFQFADVDNNSQTPRLVKTYATEAEALRQMKDNRDGSGWLRSESCEFLANGGSWWYIYYARTGNCYICDFVAEIGEDQTTGAKLTAESLNLLVRMLHAKAEHLGRHFLPQVESLAPGDVFAMNYEGEGYQIKADTANAGRYVVEWLEGDEVKERTSNHTAEDAAQIVGRWIASSVPAYESKKWRVLDFVTRKPEPVAESEPEGAKPFIITFSPDDVPELEELTETAASVADCPAGSVWQFDRYRGTQYEELHEIRNRGEWFELVVNIYDGEGSGQRFCDKFGSYSEALQALQRFRPGSVLITWPEGWQRSAA